MSRQGPPIADERRETKWNPAPPDTFIASQIFRGFSQMLGIVAAILVVLWLLGFLAFHITSGLIHLVLMIALILLVLHFVTGRRVL